MRSLLQSLSTPIISNYSVVRREIQAELHMKACLGIGHNMKVMCNDVQRVQKPFRRDHFVK